MNYDPATADRDRAEERTRCWPKFENDLKVLEANDWKELAFRVWHDSVEKKDDDALLHSQKWVGMLTARLLTSIADDSKVLRRLTVALVVLTVVLVFLTAVLCGDIILRFFHH